MEIEPEKTNAVGAILNDPDKPLAERFRALFTLRNIGGNAAVDSISECFKDCSELLKHECAYCLGQMQNEHAIPYLIEVLKDQKQQCMVRHEAGEALGAIGSKEALHILEEHCSDSVVEVAETCQLAVQRIKWLQSRDSEGENLPENPYLSVDPAPPCTDDNVESLRQTLLDENCPLFKRYRAMFSLRNIGSTEAVIALAEGLKCSSALFRHEIAYVLGQMQHPAAINQLTKNLEEKTESAMVRHECAEALGSIATDECMVTLKKYSSDTERVVYESCQVALDMGTHEQSGNFQYADSLANLEGTVSS